MRSPPRLRSSSAEARAHRARRRVPGEPRVLLIIALMLAALLGQSIAIQSHLHLAEASEWAIPTAADGDSRQGLSPLHAPVNKRAECALCRELASAGHYIAPDPIASFEARSPLPWVFVLPVLALLCRSRSHRWQSRAPPSLNVGTE